MMERIRNRETILLDTIKALIDRQAIEEHERAYQKAQELTRKFHEEAALKKLQKAWSDYLTETGKGSGTLTIDTRPTDERFADSVAKVGEAWTKRVNELEAEQEKEPDSSSAQCVAQAARVNP